MPLPLIPLIAAGVGALAATGGAIGSASNRRQARNAKNAYYDYAEDTLLNQYNRDPFTSAGNKSLLKAADRNYEKSLDAISNQMAAGGATMENALAARQANNESRDKLYGQLLMNEDARRDRITSQRLQLAGQRASDDANYYLQRAQDWNQWGGQMANAAMSLGSSMLLGGSGAIGAATGAASAAAPAVNPSIDYEFGPLAPPADTSHLGGLRHA